MEQLNIFDILEPNRFCNNDSINEIVQEIEKEFCKTVLEQKEKDYTIWQGDKKHGYRLSIVYHHPKYPLEGKPTMWLTESEALFIEELKKVNMDYLMDFSEERGIELSIIWTPFLILISTIEIKRTKKKRERRPLKSMFKKQEE